jgi:hypothetical protein
MSTDLFYLRGVTEKNHENLRQDRRSPGGDLNHNKKQEFLPFT